MSATTPRRSFSCLLFGPALFLTASCFAFVLEQHWRGRDDAGLAPRRLARAWHGPPVSPYRASNSSDSPVIDPVMAYSTYLGGTNFANIPTPTQGAYASFVDGQGNVYLTGSTNSPNFPVTSGVIQTTNPSQEYISFVSKISPDGQSLAFSTYVNLTKQYENSALAVDSSGNIFVAGTNPSFLIPAGTTPFQSTPKTADSILIVKLNSTATKVLNATYLSGSGSERLWGLAVDADGNVYATGGTNSSDFPTKNPLQATLTAGTNAFVTKLDSSLSNLLYSTYLGGTSSATANSIAVDNSKNAYVVGDAGLGFPTTSGAAQATCHFFPCGFMAKLDFSGSSLLYATYIDGSLPMSVAVDQSKNAFISGVLSAFTNDFPQVKPLQSCIPLGGFVSEISATGALAFSTCLGVNGFTYVTVDGSGVAYVTGSADDTLPLKNPIQKNANPTPSSTCFVSAIDANAGSLLFSSFLRGSCTTVGTDSNGNIYVAGYASAPFPILNALQPSPSPQLNGCLPTLTCAVTDATIVKISPNDGAAAALSPAAIAFTPQLVGTSSLPQPVTVVDMGSAPLTVSNAVATGDFSAQNGCTTAVAPAGGTCAIQVTFTPTTVGARTGALTITDSSAGSPRTVQLTGEGGQAIAMIFPTTLSFYAAIHTTTGNAITISNTGAIALQISNIQVSGAPFSETNDCGTSVAPNNICHVNVAFSPTAVGNASGTLTITDTAANSPQTLSLTATAVAASLGLGFAPSNGSIAMTAGSSATTVLGIGGAGIGGSVTLTCAGAPTGATCTLSPSTLQISATSASTVGLTVTTTARSNLLFVAPNLVPWLWATAIFGCLILLRAVSAHSSLRPRWRFVPLMALSLCACGGGRSSGGGGGGTPAGSYTISVTAQSGSTTQSFNVPLTVQ